VARVSRRHWQNRSSQPAYSGGFVTIVNRATDFAEPGLKMAVFSPETPRSRRSHSIRRFAPCPNGQAASVNAVWPYTRN